MWPVFLTRVGGFRRGVAIAAASSLVVGVMVSRLSAATADSCGPLVQGSITESQVFTPYASRRSTLPALPLNPRGEPLPTLPAALDISADVVGGLSLHWAVVVDTGAVYRYFFDRPLSGTLTPQEFWAQGGIELDLEPLTEEVPFSEYLLAEYPSRVVPITVGQFNGVVVWADPESNGVRTHRVYWSDGRHNYSLIADRPADDAVTLARSIACA